MENKSNYSPTDIIKIREDKGLCYIKTTGNYVFCIFPCKSLTLLNRKIFPHALLIISQLYNKRNLKGILQVPAIQILLQAEKNNKQTNKTNIKPIIELPLPILLFKKKNAHCSLKRSLYQVIYFHWKKKITIVVLKLSINSV